jgi:hypothetical protein
MKRKRRLLVVALAVALLVCGWWAFVRQSPVGAFDVREIHAVEVRFEPWGEERAVAPGASSADPVVVAALVAVLRTGTEAEDHKCGSRGIITLQRSPGRSAELRFLAGHHPKWYEFRYAGKLYRVPRAEFVAAMRRLGVEVPLKCE